MSPNLLHHDVSDDIMHSWNAFGPNAYVTNVNPGRPSQMSWSYIICIIQTLMLIRQAIWPIWPFKCWSQRWKATRTTRTPAFWDTPTAPWLPILVVHIRSQVKTRQSQSYKFKKIAKNSNFEILPETLHVTHLLKLLDKMHKYEMDPTRTVGATELHGIRDGRTDRWTDGRTEWNQYTPQQLCCVGGIITSHKKLWDVIIPLWSNIRH